MIRKILIGLVLLVVVGIGVSQVFKAQIGMWLFTRAIEQNIGRSLFDGLPDGLHAVMCGTGSPMSDVTRNGPCTAIIAGDRLFIVDTGSGSARGLGPMGLSAGQIEALFLTHFHSDHIDGLGELMLLRWATAGNSAPLPVYGPTGVEQVVEGFNAAYRLDQGYRVAHHTPEVLPPSGFGTEARPFQINRRVEGTRPDAPADFGSMAQVPTVTGEPVTVLEDGDLTVTAFPVPHAPIDPAVGYRFDYKGRSIVISGDTSYSQSLISAAESADVLFHDVLNREMVGMMQARFEEIGARVPAQIFADILDYHASPKEAAQAAEAAGVKLLVMYHIVPALPSSYLNAAYLRNVGDAFSGPIVVGEDGMMITLPADSDEIVRKRLR